LIKDAILTFLTCYEKNGPVNLKLDEVFKDKEDFKTQFKFLKDLRDFWIAHRHGATRQSRYVIACDDDGRIFQCGFTGFDISGFNGYAPILISMIKLSLDFISPSFEAKKDELKDIILKITPAEALRLPVLEKMHMPSTDEIRMGRRKFRNVKNQKGGNRHPSQKRPREE